MSINRIVSAEAQVGAPVAAMPHPSWHVWSSWFSAPQVVSGLKYYLTLELRAQGDANATPEQYEVTVLADPFDGNLRWLESNRIAR
jgi:hypothetical protein